jgi:MarR family transcriptional regulator, lower aerobic nicotinate degradation pathway regulator
MHRVFSEKSDDALAHVRLVGDRRLVDDGGQNAVSIHLLMKDLYAHPGHLIRRAQQLSSALFAEECGAFDLTSVQYAALVAIKAHSEVDATRLSAMIAFDRSTLGDVLERLEAKGWVLRRPSPNDKRVKLISLSQDGERVVEGVREGVDRVQERLLAPLAPADRRTLMRLLTQLVGLHNDLPPDQAQGPDRAA